LQQRFTGFSAMFNTLIRRFLLQARSRLKKRFNRTLPFGDYVSDRWEKARFLGFGENSSIYDSALVFGDVIVGHDVWVGPFTLLDGSGATLKIGDYCHISAGVQIYTHDTVDLVIQKGEISKAAINIGDHCYIGPNVVISKGVNIGDHVIIGANSFVNQDIPAHSKAWGTPAQPIA